MASKKLSYNIKWECSSLDAIKKAVINNHGLAIMSARLIKDELENEKLFIIKEKSCQWRRDIYLCYHKSKTLTPEFRPFLDAAIVYHIEGVKCPIAEQKGY